MRCNHIKLMATYNAWMNANVLDAAMTLPDEALVLDRKAFFGSILGTLNHLIVADTFWLKRFAMHPAHYEALAPILTLEMPKALNQTLFIHIRNLAEHRKMLDQIIVSFSEKISESDLDQVLHYTNTSGVASAKSFFSLLMHFFNHQTHHRGQVTTLLTQAGADVGVTDLVSLIPNEI